MWNSIFCNNRLDDCLAFGFTHWPAPLRDPTPATVPQLNLRRLSWNSPPIAAKDPTKRLRNPRSEVFAGGG